MTWFRFFLSNIFFLILWGKNPQINLCILLERNLFLNLKEDVTSEEWLKKFKPHCTVRSLDCKYFKRT